MRGRAAPYERLHPSPDFAGGRRPLGEDPRADHRADREHDEISCAQDALETSGILALGEQLADWLSREQGIHRSLGAGGMRRSERGRHERKSRGKLDAAHGNG